MTRPLRIVRLLPDLLGLNGSRGNAEVIFRRLHWWDTAVEVVDATAEQELPPSADLVTIGHGTSSLAPRALEALHRWSGTLSRWREEGVGFFGVGLGADLWGEEITFRGDARATPGLRLSPVSASLDSGSYSGEVVGVDGRGHMVAGYLNDRTRRSAPALTPLITDLAPAGPTWFGATAPGSDGVRENGLWLSALSGPLLALNPGIADEVISYVLQARGESIPAPTEQHQRADLAAERAREAIARRGS